MWLKKKDGSLLMRSLLCREMSGGSWNCAASSVDLVSQNWHEAYVLQKLCQIWVLQKTNGNVTSIIHPLYWLLKTFLDKQWHIVGALLLQKLWFLMIIKAACLCKHTYLMPLDCYCIDSSVVSVVLKCQLAVKPPACHSEFTVWYVHTTSTRKPVVNEIDFHGPKVNPSVNDQIIVEQVSTDVTTELLQISSFLFRNVK